MTREEFAARVRTIEQRFARHPAALRTRLLWLAALGFAGLLAWPLLVLLVSVVFLTPGWIMSEENAWLSQSMGALILLFGGWAVGRALWVRIPPPEGRVVPRKEAPALHAMLDQLRVKLRAAPFHQVILTSEWNASVSEVPRLGFLGFPRHYLSLGLPLMENFSVAEIRAIMAHEFAHLSARHGRIGSWLYRLRRSWEPMFAKLQRPIARGSVSLRPLILKFVNWFWPRFHTHAFVLSRANEYQADAYAVWATDAPSLAGSLYRLSVYGRLLHDRFWPEFWQRANLEPAPPAGLLPQLRAALQTGPTPEENLRWREQSFRFLTSDSDTHPCLTARLKAIKSLPENVAAGEYPAWPALPGESAAERLLGPALPLIHAAVEALWRKNASEAWTAAHARAASLQHRLDRLAETAPGSAADVDALWDRARTVIHLQNDAAAVLLLHEVLGLRPSHAGANFCLGRHLLAAGDEAGRLHLERVIEQEDDSLPAACELLLAHYRLTGQLARVREVEARLDRHEAAMAASREERARVTAADTFIPHGLSPEEVDVVRALIAEESGIASAWLAQKKMKYPEKQGLFVLCLEGLRVWYRPADHDSELAAAKRLFTRIRLPGRVLVISPQGSFRAIVAKVRKLPGGQIFARGRR